MAGDDRLSRREAQVARLYADGRNYKEIADLLCIAPATVRTHLNAIYRKLKIRSKIALARFLESDRYGDLDHPAPQPVGCELRPSASAADPAVTKLLQQLQLHRYADAFAKNAVDMEVMMTLSDSDLRELGVVAVGHRKHLLAAIQEQRSRHDRGDRAGTDHAESSTSLTIGPVAERRHLTIVFVDLVGSTELSTRLDPEQMRDLLDDYHKAVAQAVEGFDGHVANVMGDGALVYFGWPRAHEDDAERAVWASLAVRTSIEALHHPDGRSLAVRIGIASGLVVVGQGMGQDAAVVGDAPNLASRLQGLAREGQIVISPKTAELVRGVFAVTNLGPQPIKGLDQPVDVFEVQGPHAHLGRFEARARQGLVGIVGRTLELGLLETCWRRATCGEGQVALLTGEPGIGKSRVLRALRDSENVRPKSRATVHCSPYHTQAALHPFAEALARSLAEDGSADRATRRTRLRHLLKEAGSNSRLAFHALARLVSIAAEGDPPATDAQEERTQTLDALVDLLLGAAHQQPRLLLIEDVHWIDPSSHELLNGLVDLVPMLPLLLVITARLEFVPSWRHGGHVTNLNLGRLEPEQAALLVDRVAEPTKLNVEIRDQIVAMADGVPLFVEELTKTLLESGSEGGGARAGSSDVERPMKIPETLHDVLMARLDRMPPAKMVAQTAAAIGRRFGHETLIGAASWPPGLLEQGLDQLIRAGLLIRRGRPPDATYLFKHALIRDEAYQSLLLPDRRRIHGGILRALEQTQEATPSEGAHVASVDQFSVLARHASLAELWHEAARYHHRAGLAARALWAIEEAIGQFRKALEAFERLRSGGCGDDLRDATMSTTLALCECLYFAGSFRDSFDLLDSYRDGLAAIDDSRLRGRARYWLARLTSRIGRQGPIQGLAELAIADSLSCGDKITAANAYNVLCIEHLFTGAPDDSVAAGRRAISLLERDGPSEPMGFAYHYISLAHVFAGRFIAAIDATARALETADRIDHPRLRCYGRAVRGWSLGMSGHHEEGLRELGKASALAPDAATRIFVIGYTGCVQYEEGALEESAARLTEAHAACLAFPSPQFAALFGAVLADALRRLGRASEAQSVAEKSLEIGRAAQSPFGTGLAVRAIARLTATRSDQAAAIALFEEAAEILSSAGATFELARTYLDLAWLGEQDPPAAVAQPDYAERAERLLRGLGLASDAPRPAAALGCAPYRAARTVRMRSL